MEFWRDDYYRIERGLEEDPNFPELHEGQYVDEFVDRASRFGWDAPFDIDWVDVKLKRNN